MILYQHIDVPEEQDLYVVGDLHGSWELYQRGLKQLGIGDNDVIISLGDLTDRGKQNFRCVVEFTRKENRYAIRGNHEDMMIRGMLEGRRDYYQCWYQNGGNTVWDELGEEGVTLLATMLEELPVILTVGHRGKTYAFIHAGYPSIFEHLPIPHIPAMDLSGEKLEAFAQAIMWDRDMVTCAQEGIKLPTVKGVDYIFHGHSYVPEPLINANRVYMDTGGVFNGKLTFARPTEDGKIHFHTTSQWDMEEGTSSVYDPQEVK